MDMCVEFGEPDPRRMRDKVGNGPAFALWQAYYKREPFGYLRHNLHALQILLPWMRREPNEDDLIRFDNQTTLDKLWEEYKAQRDGSDTNREVQHSDQRERGIDPQNVQ